MQDVSEDMIVAMFAESGGDPIIALVTITAAGLDGPMLFANAPVDAGSNNPGVTSRGNFYAFAPFDVAWGGASQNEPIRQTQLVIGDAEDVRISNAIRTVTGQPAITIELVRLSDPDTVEMAILGAVLGDATIQGPKITGTIIPMQFSTEPACSQVYTPASTPSLF